ncbi:MAG: hypothetical protein FJ395_04635 [Verrucomicrobia bacterium]|nr:hypothetical protein [Verrucomicrobiota bacterium]
MKMNLLILLAVLGCLPVDAEPTAELKKLRETRNQLAHRQRRVIFNNDGCDVLYYPKDEKLTLEQFLARRTTSLAGTQVDTISYCTISSGFSFFTHNTKVGAVLTRQPGDYGIRPEMRNITQELIDMGTDCLQAVLEFAHKNKMECFWSMRMNDTHDAAYRPDKPYLLYPQLKLDHPDWLVGDPIKRSRYGRWSSVDYARPEIRDLAFRFIEEVCQNYDVDGVELDFFRHLCYFKSTAHGGKSNDAEREMMTGLMRRVRAMTEEVGLKRKRPILIMVRVPDSVEFNRDMGLDVERWLKEGLFDMLVTTCYFRLNPWEASVALGHKYGVPVYPCLSDSRVKGEGRFRRGSVESYRGQAMEAWAAGADGIHLFNLFDVFGAHSPVFKEAGDPKALRKMNRLYFVTVRDGKPDSWLAGGSKYCNVPIFTPTHPKAITASKPLALDLVVGEDFDAKTKSQVTLHAQMPMLRNVRDVQVKLNGHELADGKLVKDWLDLKVNPLWIKKGANKIEIAVNPQMADDAPWTAAYEADELPAKPWTRDTGSPRTEERLANGTLTIADRGNQSGDFHYYRYRWGADPGGQSVVEARVKVISGLSRIIISNGEAQERLELLPDRIELWSRKSVRYAMDTTKDFHVYRIVTQGKDVKVYVDGELRLDAPGAYTKAGVGRNEICFGASDSTNVGEACWDYVRARANGQSCYDLVLEVVHPK